MENERIQYVTFPALDGFELTGTAYWPEDEKANGGAVLVAAATGVKRGYYHKFAHYLSDRGFKVLTFDYRGIGHSRPDNLKGFEADMAQWGTDDMPGAMTWIEENFKPKRRLMVGHSVAGQILSIVPGSERFDKILLVASQLGEWRNWSGIHRFKVLLFWYVVLPLLVALNGYMPGWFLGSEDLPRGVALKWRKWGVAPGYILSDGPHVREGFAKVKASMLFYSLTDDLMFGPDKAVQSLVDVYTNAKTERRHISPKEADTKSIGHFGFFSSRFKKNLWTQSADWLEET